MSMRLLAVLELRTPPATRANAAVEGAGHDSEAAESQERGTESDSWAQASVDAE